MGAYGNEGTECECEGYTCGVSVRMRRAIRSEGVCTVIRTESSN